MLLKKKGFLKKSQEDDVYQNDLLDEELLNEDPLTDEEIDEILEQDRKDREEMDMDDDYDFDEGEDTPEEEHEGSKNRGFDPVLRRPVFNIPSYNKEETDDEEEEPRKVYGPSLDGKQLLVGSQIHMTGEVRDCDTLIVEGTVDATTIESRYVEVLTDGTLRGNADMDEAVVSGKFEGTLNVKGQLLITSTGSVNGNIRYGSIQIESGGTLSGDVASIDDSGLDIDLNSIGSKRPKVREEVKKTA